MRPTFIKLNYKHGGSEFYLNAAVIELIRQDYSQDSGAEIFIAAHSNQPDGTDATRFVVTQNPEEIIRSIDESAAQKTKIDHKTQQTTDSVHPQMTKGATHWIVVRSSSVFMARHIGDAREPLTDAEEVIVELCARCAQLTKERDELQDAEN